MSKSKAYLITVAFMAVFGCVIFMLSKWQIWSYYTLMQILGFYGFGAFGLRLANWLAKPEPKPEKKETFEDWSEI